ncbi:MAG: dethiobiotin synthase [Frankiales bacterium]|nr:dethiobiotin synthase [Frankiales bacterium]
MKVIVVTGTGTDVGKTIVTAALTSCARQSGDRVAVVKPVQTGVQPGEPGDLATVRRLTGCEDLFEYVRYAEPLAPATAARRQGEPGPRMEDLAEQIAALDDYDLVLVEGAGGALVRFNDSDETLLDLLDGLLEHDIGQSYGRPVVRTHQLEVVLVITAGLGSLHHLAATSIAMEVAHVEPDHLVIGSWPTDPGLAERCNLSDLSDYNRGFARLSGALPEGAGDLEPAAFAELAMRSLTPALSGNLNAREFIMSHRPKPPAATSPPVR